MFTTPVSMYCTEEQYIRDLKKHLLKAGYKERSITDWSHFPYLVTNWNSDHNMLGNGDITYIYDNYRYYIDHYNPELFLALASMTDDEHFKVGDWIMETWKASPYYNKTPFQIVEIANPIIRYSRDENTGRAYDQNLRKATKEELINYFTKTQNTMSEKRFPFKLTIEQGKRIINIACPSWKEKLANKWSKDFILNEYVSISEDFYKEMRKACTEPQSELFDEIFGKDEPEYKIGDFITVVEEKNRYWGTKDETYEIFGIDSYGNFKFTKEGDKLIDPSMVKIRKATPEEIKKFKNKCPYKDGEYILVKDSEDFAWKVYKCTGRFVNGNVEVYSFINNNRLLTFEYHGPLPEGFQLPQ